MSADFDKAIDGAVREMLDVEPPADLRARVIERIEQPRRSMAVPVASSFSWKILAPLAAAALIVLAVFVARRSEPLPQASVVVQGTNQQPPVDIAHDAPAAPAPIVTASVSERRGTSPLTRTVAAASVADDADAAVPVEPLKSIAPISIAPITQDGIAPADIAVRPLNTINEIQIAPLTPPDRRD